MATTRKDLELIANAVANTRRRLEAVDGQLPAGYMLAVIADELCDALRVTTGRNVNGNSRFNRERFLKACGLSA
jgi:hypothetical protein